MREFDIEIENMVCPYCGSKVKLADRFVVSHRDDALGSGKIYVCERYPSCDSYVGCNLNTDIPLGTLANAELRRIRMQAHKAFDWLWKSGRMSRKEAYQTMQKVTGLNKDKAHIGMMNVEQCRQIAEIFGEFKAINTSYKLPKAI